MIQIAKWAGSWLKCKAVGHRMRRARIYYPPAKSVTSGWRCERCGKEQLLLWRWQEPVSDGSGSGDEEEP